jgi:hypothetical protein
MTGITINPMAVTTGAGMFNAQSVGYVQGDYTANLHYRLQLQAGQLASTEMLPIWGGIPIQLYIPGTNNQAAGGSIARATTVAQILGFTTFSQAVGMIQSAQNPVPLASQLQTVNYFETGSGVQLVVACDPSFAATLEGGLINQACSWDFNNQCLQAYDASTATVSVTSITSSFANGVYTFVVVAAAATVVGAVGDLINISGVTSTGSTYVNGNQTITAYTDNQHFSFQVTAATGTIATGVLTGTIILNEGVGTLSVKIKNVSIGNCMTVSYNSTTGAALWNRNGTCALIEI